MIHLTDYPLRISAGMFIEPLSDFQNHQNTMQPDAYLIG